jgi:hypothetical protein
MTFINISEVTAMVNGTVKAFEGQPRRLQQAALKACQWRLVSADGRAVQPTSCLLEPARLGQRETGLVFDGRDNEAAKLAFFQAALKTPLFFDILPQVA